MYDDDSFVTLSFGGQIGLAILSLVLSVALVWLVWRLGRTSRWATRALIGMGGFVIFTWLSPQIYFIYYLMILEGLQTQWVIQWPPEIIKAAQEFTFNGQSSLAAHGRGILGWVCILVPLIFDDSYRPPGIIDKHALFPEPCWSRRML